MGMDRRAFLKLGGALAIGSLLTPGTQYLMAAQEEKPGTDTKTRWAMVVDLNKCTGCRVCEKACRKENNVPYYGNSEDEKRYNAYWLRVADVTPKEEIFGEGVETKHIPLMCQHCDDPPCVHVCVTKASFKRNDGIVLVDEHRCIGCRYCIVACPYRARSIIFKENDAWSNTAVPKIMISVATKCSFCVQRVDAAVAEGKNPVPACVEACPHDALKFGNLKDPKSEVAKIMAGGNVQVLRPNLEVGPGVFYKGL